MLHSLKTATLILLFSPTLLFASSTELKQYKIYKSVQKLAEETFDLMDSCFAVVIQAKNGDMTPKQFQIEKNNFINKINRIIKNKNIVVKYVDEQYHLYNKPFFETYFSFFHVAENTINKMTIHDVDKYNYNKYKKYLKSAFWVGKRTVLPFDLHLSELRKQASKELKEISKELLKKEREFKDRIFLCQFPKRKPKLIKEKEEVCENLNRGKDRLSYIINDECPNDVKLFRLEAVYKKELIKLMTQQEVIFIKGHPDIIKDNCWIYKKNDPRYIRAVQIDEYLYFDSYGRLYSY